MKVGTIPNVWPDGKEVYRKHALLTSSAIALAKTKKDVKPLFKAMMKAARPDYAEGTLDARWSLERHYFNKYMGVSI